MTAMTATKKGKEVGHKPCRPSFPSLEQNVSLHLLHDCFCSTSYKFKAISCFCHEYVICTSQDLLCFNRTSCTLENMKRIFMKCVHSNDPQSFSLLLREVEVLLGLSCQRQHTRQTSMKTKTLMFLSLHAISGLS